MGHLLKIKCIYKLKNQKNSSQLFDTHASETVNKIFEFQNAYKRISQKEADKYNLFFITLLQVLKSEEKKIMKRRAFKPFSILKFVFSVALFHLYVSYYI